MKKKKSEHVVAKMVEISQQVFKTLEEHAPAIAAHLLQQQKTLLDALPGLATIPGEDM